MMPKMRSTIPQTKCPTHFEPITQMMPMINCIMPLANAPMALNAEKAKKGDPIIVSRAKIMIMMPPIRAKM